MTIIGEYKLLGEDYKIYWKSMDIKTKIKDIPSDEIIDWIKNKQPTFKENNVWYDIYTDVLNKRRIKKIHKLKNNGKTNKEGIIGTVSSN